MIKTTAKNNLNLGGTARLLAILVVLLLATAAVSAAPQESSISPAREQELFSRVDEMLETVSEIMGLEVLKPVERELITRDEVRELVETRLAEETTSEEIRLEELFLKKFGLVDEDFDLAAEMTDILTEQATALYDFKTKKLYLASWTPPDMQEFALIHELAHALQDQHFDLQKYVDKGKGADGDLARSAVVEGQASWIMTEYVLQEGGRSMAENRLMAVAAVSASRFEAEKYPVFSSSPLFMRETMLFPYTHGLLFQQALVEEHGKASFAEVFRRPPLSSQQIFDPAVYLERRKPTRPRLPKAKLGRSFKKVSEGEIGQLDHLVLLKKFFTDEKAEALAPQWRGDRYEIRENSSKDRAVLLYAAEWESPDAAKEYFDLYKQIVQRKDRGVEFQQESDDMAIGRGASGGFVLSRAGAVVTSVEGVADDKLEESVRRYGSKLVSRAVQPQ